jgi:hypothetical protein
MAVYKKYQSRGSGFIESGFGYGSGSNVSSEYVSGDSSLQLSSENIQHLKNALLDPDRIQVPN